MLREAFTHQTGLTTTQWMRGAAVVAVRYFIWVANARPHLATLDDLMEVELPVRLSASFRKVVDRELVTTLDELGRAVLAELQRGGVTYAGLGSTLMHDSRAMRDRPLLRDATVYCTRWGSGCCSTEAWTCPAMWWNAAAGSAATGCCATS
jgi:hypothetical protein